MKKFISILLTVLLILTLGAAPPTSNCSETTIPDTAPTTDDFKSQLRKTKQLITPIEDTTTPDPTEPSTKKPAPQKPSTKKPAPQKPSTPESAPQKPAPLKPGATEASTTAPTKPQRPASEDKNIQRLHYYNRTGDTVHLKGKQGYANVDIKILTDVCPYFEEICKLDSTVIYYDYTENVVVSVEFQAKVVYNEAENCNEAFYNPNSSARFSAHEDNDMDRPYLPGLDKIPAGSLITISCKNNKCTIARTIMFEK